jgi:hypothetical protein
MFDTLPAASNARSRFYLDPWASDYGSALEASLEDEAEPDREPPEYIEQPSWSTPITPAPAPRPSRTVFVDGVQRVDAFGRIETADTLVEAALASIAVGAVVCDDDGAGFAPEPVIDRVLALTDGAEAEAFEVRAGAAVLTYEAKASAHRGAAGIRNAINERRSELERRYAEELARDDCLTILDGRLTFDPDSRSSVVGYVKSIYEFYVDVERRRLLLQLAAGQRSPVFRIKHGRTTRYSWFLKLPNVHAIHHPYAGLVRLETPEVGQARALALADLVSSHLPAFASRPEKDPRAPQNLIPVGALEWKLRHLLGDALFIRRSIERTLYSGAAL